MTDAKPLKSVKSATEPEPHSNLFTRPLNKVYQLYVGGETRAASALESVVGSNAFGELLAMSASNAMAVARIVNGGADKGVRMVRIAGRADITGLARQLARTEDKLERMLELVESLADHVDDLADRVEAFAERIDDLTAPHPAEKESNGTRPTSSANHKRPAAARRRSS